MIHELKTNIHAAKAEIETHFCEKVIQNFKERVVVRRKSPGGHFENTLYHTCTLFYTYNKRTEKTEGSIILGIDGLWHELDDQSHGSDL